MRRAEPTASALLVFLAGDSDPNKELLAEHPIKDQPVTQQSKRTQNRGLHRHAEYVQNTHSQVDLEAALDKLLKEMGDHVCGNGVHADDHKRKRNASMLFYVDY